MSVAKVKCPICGQEISKSNYSKHERRHKNHPESFKQGHDGLICQYCGKECKNQNSLVQHEIRCKENPNRKDFIKPKFNNKGRVAWNKGLTKETDERVKKNGESVRSAFASGKARKLTGEANPAKKENVREKISKTCLKKSSVGEWHTSLAKNMHYNYNDCDLHGKWELDFAKYLDSNSIIWTRCKERFSYLFEGKEHYYTPDFYLNDYELYVEIKGYQTLKDEAKWSCFPSDKKLIVLKYDDLKQLGVVK